MLASWFTANSGGFFLRAVSAADGRAEPQLLAANRQVDLYLIVALDPDSAEQP